MTAVTWTFTAWSWLTTSGPVWGKQVEENPCASGVLSRGLGGMDRRPPTRVDRIRDGARGVGGTGREQGLCKARLARVQGWEAEVGRASGGGVPGMPPAGLGAGVNQKGIRCITKSSESRFGNYQATHFTPQKCCILSTYTFYKLSIYPSTYL